MQVFEVLVNTQDSSLLDAPIREFLLSIEQRGIYTMLGLRKTTGSQLAIWPRRDTLLSGFNRPHTVLTDEQRAKIRNPPSQLTVGARALCKHAHRSSEGFWGNVKGTEGQKN